jgi:calcineurin-like phosphoesterase family protein
VQQAWRQRGRQINVGVDAWAGRPVPEETLVELIAAGPAERDPRPWC